MLKQKPPELIPEALLYKVMREMGLEPTRSHPRQILSLMRLPFRHSRVLQLCYSITGFLKVQAYIL